MVAAKYTKTGLLILFFLTRRVGLYQVGNCGLPTPAFFAPARFRVARRGSVRDSIRGLIQGDFQSTLSESGETPKVQMCPLPSPQAESG